MKNEITILAEHLYACKQAEDTAKAIRMEAEARLLDALEFDKPEGSKTYKAPGYKITCKAGMNYTLDKEAWNQIEHLIPDGLRPVRTKLEADQTGCKWLRDNEPDTWAIAARAITAKPAKVSVSVEIVSDAEAA